MKSLLEKLWDLYLSEQTIETDPQRITMVGEIADSLDALLVELNDSQRKLFHAYNELQNEYHAQTELDAFTGGIHFTAELLTEMRGAKN